MIRTAITLALRWTAASLAALTTIGVAHAVAPVAEPDAYTARSGVWEQYGEPGVLENDHDFGAEPPLPEGAIASVVTGVNHGALFLYDDGSFEYTSDLGFVGIDTFSYNFVDASGTSNTAVVTIDVIGCEAGGAPTQWVCWVEQAYLAKAAELGKSTFTESFENDVTWAVARYPATAASVSSQGVTWASNHPGNEITTGSGAARSGDWGIYSLPHGDQTLTQPNDRIHDGFTGAGSSPNSLLGVGGWLEASQVGSQIDLIVTYNGGGTTTAGFPDHTLSYDDKFFGFIDTDGFSSFEFMETDGTVNQPYFVFGDDFSFVVSGQDNTPPRVVEISSWEETSGGVISEGEVIDVDISELMVRFSEPVQDPPGHTDSDDVTNPANYLLFDDGGNGFDTADCAAGVAAGDNPVAVEVWQYLSGEPSETILLVNGGTPLPAGQYRLLVCGTTSILDWAGNVLDGDGDGTGGDDFVRSFQIGGAVVPAISINDASVTEGDVGTTNMTFTITLSAASTAEVRVSFATAAGTATSGIDFLAASGTAIFPPSTLTQSVQVAVVGDLEPEFDETFTVGLTAPLNATIADSTGSGTILDDDPWTWFVAKDGHDGNDCLTALTACLTISEAVSRALAGDQVNVARGVYGENVVLPIDLTLQGELPTGTVIDGGSTGTVVSVDPATTAVVSGFEIRNGGAVGVANQGDLTIEDSWIHSNGESSPLSFGGLFNQGTALVRRVAIVDNVGGTTGGVYNSGQLEIRNATISGNAADFAPGINNLSGGTLALHYSTVADNGSHGIRVGDVGSTTLRGTIVSGHTTANCDGTVNSLGYSLEDADTCGLRAGAGDLVGVDPLLGALVNNGGSSPTHAIVMGSPAVDAGETTGLPATDQRGVARPQDGDLNGAAVGDIGAYEAHPGAIFSDGFESGDTSAWSG